METIWDFIKTLWLFMTFQCGWGELPSDEDVLDMLELMEDMGFILYLKEKHNIETPWEEKKRILQAVRQQVYKFGLRTPTITVGIRGFYRNVKYTFEEE